LSLQTPIHFQCFEFGINGQALIDIRLDDGDSVAQLVEAPG